MHFLLAENTRDHTDDVPVSHDVQLLLPGAYQERWAYVYCDDAEDGFLA